MLGGIFNRGDSSSSSSNSSSGARSVPRPIAQIPQPKMSPERLKAYEAAIEGVLDRPELELLSAQITAHFIENGIPLFDYGETYDYLTDRQIIDDDQSWHWAHVHKAGAKPEWGTDSYPCKPGYHSPRVQKLYELIPIRVLGRIKVLQQTFGDRLTFFVSRNGHKHRYIMALVDMYIPDPDTIFIFDHWDTDTPGTWDI